MRKRGADGGWQVAEVNGTLVIFGRVDEYAPDVETAPPNCKLDCVKVCFNHPNQTLNREDVVGLRASEYS